MTIGKTLSVDWNLQHLIQSVSLSRLLHLFKLRMTEVIPLYSEPTAFCRKSCHGFYEKAKLESSMCLKQNQFGDKKLKKVSKRLAGVS